MMEDSEVPSTSAMMTGRRTEESTTFERAKAFLPPSAVFRFVTNLYVERKLLVVLMVHFMITTIIWGKRMRACSSSVHCLLR